MRDILLFLPFALLISYCNSQEVKKRITDLEDEKLKGSVKSVTTIIVDVEEDTKFVNYVTLYSKEGMIRVEKVFEKDYGYQPERGIDSITYSYDSYNRLITETRHEWFDSDYISTGKENRASSWVYAYNDTCDKVISVTYNVDQKFEDGTEEHSSDIETYKYNDDCQLIYSGESFHTTSYLYDTKGRLTKKAEKYGDVEKSSLVQSYTYDDVNNSVTYLEYNEVKEVFEEKEIQYYDVNDNLIKKEYYDPPAWGESVLFSNGENTEPTKIHLTKLYKYNSDNDIIQEVHLGEKGEETIRSEVEYLENGGKQTFYENGSFDSRDEWRYENKKVVEEKEYDSEDSDQPISIYKKNYLPNGNLESETTSYPKKKNIYKTVYEYDNVGNKISEKTYKNKTLTESYIYEIEYFK